MIEREDPQETEKYGTAPWVVGALLSAVIISLMFLLADTFH